MDGLGARGGVCEMSFRRRGVRRCVRLILLIILDQQLIFNSAAMEAEPPTYKQYVLEDIMKKRKKDREAVENKLRSRQQRRKRGKKEHEFKNPEKFIKQYRNAQKSYAYLRKQNKRVARHKITSLNTHSYGKLLLAIRIRGVTDISEPQKLILKKLKLNTVNSAVFLKGSSANLKQLKRIENYITYGQPSNKTVKQLIYKKMYGKVENRRLQINSNTLVEEYIGGAVICLEDVVSQICSIGPNFKRINDFIYPFKLTTPAGTLMSRMRKPVGDGGQWGYRGPGIDQLLLTMI